MLVLSSYVCDLVPIPSSSVCQAHSYEAWGVEGPLLWILAHKI